MNRSKRKTLILSCLLVLSFNIQSSEKAPNILFLMIDDLNTWVLNKPGRYGGNVIAPNIKGLAQSGINFTRSYTVTPKCAPSRTAIFSGIASWKIGYYDNGVNTKNCKLLNSVLSMPQVLQKNGYHIATFGKVYHGYKPGVKWDAKFSHNRDPAPPAASFNKLSQRSNGSISERDWGPTHLKETEMHDTKIADHAILELEKDHEKPFFIACGLFHPHMPWYVPQKYFDMYPLDKLTLPPLKEDDLNDVSDAAKSIIASTYDEAIAHKQYEKGVQGYLATTTYADYQIGRVIKALDNSKYKDNTIVILLSDHGFHVGEKKHWQKGTLWEDGTNTLLMFRGPGLKAGQECQRTVSLLDLYPTIMELAGIEKPKHLNGRSLLPLLHVPNSEWNYPAISTYQEHITVRTEDYRLIRYKDGSTELYNSNNDPNEWTNQANNPEYSTIKKKLNALLPTHAEMAPAMDYVKKSKKPKY